MGERVVERNADGQWQIQDELSEVAEKDVSKNGKVSDPVISLIQFSWSQLQPADVFDINRQILLNHRLPIKWDIIVPSKDIQPGHRSGGVWLSLGQYVEPDELRGAEYLFPASSVQREDENQSRITGLFVVEEVYGPRQGILSIHMREVVSE